MGEAGDPKSGCLCGCGGDATEVPEGSSRPGIHGTGTARKWSVACGGKSLYKSLSPTVRIPRPWSLAFLVDGSAPAAKSSPGIAAG